MRMKTLHESSENHFCFFFLKGRWSGEQISSIRGMNISHSGTPPSRTGWQEWGLQYPGAGAIGRLASLSTVQLAHTQHLACLHQVEGCLPLYLGDEAGNRALWEGFEHLWAAEGPQSKVKFFLPLSEAVVSTSIPFQHPRCPSAHTAN